MTLIQSHNFQTSPLAQNPETLIGNISLMPATHSASAKEFLEFTFCFSRSCVDCPFLSKGRQPQGRSFFALAAGFTRTQKKSLTFPSPTTLFLFRVLGFQGLRVLGF
jgi:hypothetical protein